MVKRLNSDLLLFLRQKSYVHQHLLYRFLFGKRKEEGKKKKINRHTPKVCVAGVDKCSGL